MAETKTRSTSGRPSKAARSKSKSRKRSNDATSKNGSATAKRARKAAGSTARQAGSAASDAGQSVGKVARKAKTPLIAGGAAVAGAAGGLALGARSARKAKALRRPRVKIRSQDFARAARDVGQFGIDVGELAAELRKNREAANGGKHRSPVEVVLEGLTHRRGSGS